MCGICGVLSYTEPPEPSLVKRMMGRMRHRGPDGSGYFRDQRCALGHTRLAIIGVEQGAQPLANEDESLWISFNGEIFNYIELREELRGLGHRFRTRTDTEVIIHAWEEWGEGCFTRFNGQWALALWDRRRERLILSRDRVGIRPLFFTLTPDRFLFASEVKCLFADSSVPRRLSPDGLTETFTFWSTVAPTTVFDGVEQLEPGHFAIVDDKGFRKHPYWEPEFPAHGEEPGQDLAVNSYELRERLVEACRLRFERSDVPVGAYVSGGIDSSISAALIARYTDTPLHTFSLRFADSEFDEGHYQREMVDRLGTEHRDIVVESHEIGEIFPEVIRHAETPLLRAGPAPMYLLSKLVRESGYKVVVTGEGADEVLAGYDIFREARVRLFWARNPDSELRARATELLYPWLARSPGKAPAFSRGFFGRNLDPNDPAVSHRTRWDSTRPLLSLMTPEYRDAAGTDVVDALLGRIPTGSEGWDPISRAQWLEIATLLPGYILSSQGDRMLMANSVEGRFPFLDRDVIEFANSLPARHKLLGLDEKHILKLAFADLIPDDIVNRPKQPYRAPDASSFFGPRQPDWLADLVSPDEISECGVFEPRMVAGLVAKCQRTAGIRISNTDNMRMMAVISTQLVHSQFINDGGGSAADEVPPEPMIVIDLVTGERMQTDGS